jgi:ABC-2 type transport system permease protein
MSSSADVEAARRVGVLAPYRALLSARFRTMLQYRAAAIAGAGTQFFWGFIRIMILMAFYRSSPEAPPMDLADVISYIWLGQAFLALLPWTHDRDLEGLIREGGVAYELLRPTDLYSLWYVRTLAGRVAATSLRCIPILVFAGLLLPLVGMPEWRLAPPPSLAAFVAFVVALLVALALGVALTMLVHVSLLWTISGDGVARLMPSLVMVFSGMVIPLPLFPDWAQPFLSALPFRALVDVPFRLYTGDIPAGEALAPIALALLWTVALVVLGRRLLARGQRVLVVQGG